jgi:translocation protein SEC63
MLQYDNSAFYFFALSFISIYIFPSWWYIIKKVYRAFFGLSDADIGAVVRTADEKKKAAALKKSQKGFSLLKSQAFVVNLLLTIACTFLFVYLSVSVSNDGEVNSFDPFHILGIDSGADTKEIKKAYKKMSLLYHPDKNPNNPSAEAMFMMVAKAYEALTDATAKENYEKYGNPDGKQSLEVSIGLPSWLLDTDNRNFVLMAYLLIMVVVIPFSVWRYYSDSSKFGEKDVMYDTYSWFHHTLNEHTINKSLPEIFAGSAEFRQKNMPKTQAEKEEIGKTMTKVRSQMQKPKFNHPVCVKGNVLLHAHLLRKTDELSEGLKADLKYMLRVSSSLIDAMISVCKHQESMQTALNCISFGQYVAQACWTKDSSLLQLPYFTAEEVKHVTKGKASQKASNLAEYLKIEDDKKKGVADFSEEQKKDIFKCCSLMPDLTVETKVFVDDDEDDKVYEGDLCTVKVTLTRNNLQEGEKAGLVHAPHFPYPKQEAWWVVLGTTEGKIISIEKVTNPNRVVEHEIKFLAPREGEYEFDLHVMSTAYMGLDQQMKVGLTTLDASALPEYKVHPDDAELDDEPTLFEEMLNANVEEDSDSDDDSDDESEEEGIKELSTAERKKQELQNARKKAAAAAGDDSDSDSEVEEVYTEK